MDTADLFVNSSETTLGADCDRFGVRQKVKGDEAEGGFTILHHPIAAHALAAAALSAQKDELSYVHPPARSALFGCGTTRSASCATRCRASTSRPSRGRKAEKAWVRCGGEGRTREYLRSAGFTSIEVHQP